MELNKTFLIGNLTRDPETRHTNNGAQVTKFSLASNRKTGSGDNRREEVLYIDIEAWNRTAELCGQYLKKGSQVLVEGRLKLDQYQTQSGENRQKIFIVADRVQFGQRQSGEQEHSEGGQNRSDSTQTANSGHSGYGNHSKNDPF